MPHRTIVSRAALCVALLLGLAASASAQARPAPTSPFALEAQGGWIGFADEGRIDHGLVGVALPIRLAKRLSVGPELVYAIGPSEDRDLFLTGNVWVTLGTVTDEDGGPSFSPFIVGTYGLMRHTDRTPYWTYSSTELTASVGAGLRIEPNERWYIAPEFRFGMALHMRVSVSVGYRF